MPKRFKCLLGEHLIHAIEVSQWTFALETWAARKVEGQDVRFIRKWRSEIRAAGTIKCEHGFVQGGGDVHQARIVGNDHACAGEQVDGIGKVGDAAKVTAYSTAEMLNFFAYGDILGRADQPDLISFCR